MGKRREERDVRRPEDWFAPLRSPTVADTDTAIAAALAAVDINTTAPIAGGGNLDSDLTLSLNGTKAQFNSACSDGDFLFVGDITSYTDEQAQDTIAAAFAAGTHTGITVTYNDAGNSLSLASTITQYTDEMARDAVGTALVAGANITITVNDPGDTITIAATGGGSYTDEEAQDAVGTILVDSATIDFSYSDTTPSITASIIDDSVTWAKVQNAAANTVICRAANTSGDVSEVALSASNLLGRGSSGNVAAITMGAGLAFAAAVLSSGVWQLVDTSGAATGSPTWTWSTNVTSVAVTGLANYNELLILVRGVSAASSGIRRICVSVDNGVNWFTASGDYVAIDDNGAETATTGFQHDTASTSARSMLVHIHNLKGLIKGATKSGARAHTLFVASSSDINAIRLDNSAGGNLTTAGTMYVFAR